MSADVGIRGSRACNHLLCVIVYRHSDKTNLHSDKGSPVKTLVLPNTCQSLAGKLPLTHCNLGRVVQALHELSVLLFHKIHDISGGVAVQNVDFRFDVPLNLVLRVGATRKLKDLTEGRYLGTWV